MFSKLGNRSVSLLRLGTSVRCLSQSVPRACAVAVPQTGEVDVVAQAKEITDEMKDKIAVWSEAHALYNSPERDYVNFPLLERPNDTVGFRCLIFPAPWFDSFYKETGVTGPYMIALGSAAFLISKELFVAYEKVIMFSFTMFFLRNFWYNSRMGKRQQRDAPTGFRHRVQPKVLGLMDKFKHLGINQYETGRTLEIEETKEFISQIDEIVEQEAGKKYIYEAYKENVDFQLEEQYRQRLQEVHDAVKKRLDFQVALDAAKRNFEQKHMVNYIVDSVRKSITAQQEQEMLAKCFADLKTLAGQQK